MNTETKLSIEIHGVQNTSLLKEIACMIGKHNAKEADISLSVIEGHFRANAALYDYKGARLVSHAIPAVLELFIDEKLFVTIKEERI
mgnify:CR=1 FL=1